MLSGLRGSFAGMGNEVRAGEDEGEGSKYSGGGLNLNFDVIRGE